MNDLRVFFNRHFVLALVGYFFLFLAVSLFFIYPLFLKQFQPTQTRIGLIMGVHSFMAIFVRPFFGRLIDVRPRKEISLVGLGVLLAAVPLFHLVRDAGALPIALRALTGLGWGISMTATIAICSDLAPVEKLAHSMGIIGVAGLIASAVGPVLAEEVVQRFGFHGLFWASTLFLAAAIGCVLATRESAPPACPENRPAREIWRKFSLFSLVLIGSLPVFHGAVRSAVVYFIAVFARSIAVERIGPFFVMFSGAAILTRLFIGDVSDRYGRKQVIFPAALIISLNCLLLALVRGSGMFLLAGFVGGLGQGLIFPALSTYVIDVLGRENKGLALSLYLSLFDVGMGVGSPFFGWVSDVGGYRNMYLVAGGFLFVFNIIFAIKAPAPRRESPAGIPAIPGGPRFANPPRSSDP
jgi:MFS family permease